MNRISINRCFYGVAGFIIVCLLSRYCLEHVSYPFIYIGVAFSVFFLTLTFLSASVMKVIAWNAAAVALIFTSFECAFIHQAEWATVQSADGKTEKMKIQTLGSYSAPNVYFQEDPFLGYKPRPDIAVRSRRMHGNEALYDVTYTIGPDGLRSCNQRPVDAKAPGILFFGDSFTFGEGLDDAQTYPCRFEEESGGRYKTFNFAFHGYGPQQMLLWLDSGRERTIAGRHRPVGAVYLAIPAHLDRGAGWAGWDFMGPRFALNGTQVMLVPKGPLAQWRARTFWRFRQSALLYRMMPWFLHPSPPNYVEESKLFIRMVDQSKRLFQARYHGRFLVILWWRPEELFYPAIVSQLNDEGIASVNIAQIIPDIWENNAAYVYKDDHHPNAVADQRIADYLVRVFQPIP